jgi:NAD(P)-dependent dehydrogenase (short-subunit alcohol dehydrogenase family)
VNISSGVGSLTWQTGSEVPHDGKFAAYHSSKAALNMVTVSYAYALGDAFKANAVAPGRVHTDLNAIAAGSDRDPADGAAGAVRPALLPADGPTGQFFSWDGTPAPGNPRPDLPVPACRLPSLVRRPPPRAN